MTLLRDRRGQDFVEYALLVAFAAACAVGSFPAILATGSYLDTVMQSLLDALNRVAAG